MTQDSKFKLNKRDVRTIRRNSNPKRKQSYDELREELDNPAKNIPSLSNLNLCVNNESMTNKQVDLLTRNPVLKANTSKNR